MNDNDARYLEYGKSRGFERRIVLTWGRLEVESGLLKESVLVSIILQLFSCLSIDKIRYPDDKIPFSLLSVPLVS